MGLLYSILILGSWLIPLHLLPWVGWHQEVMGFTLVLIIGWHVLVVSRTSGKVLIPNAALILGVLAGIISIQWFANQIGFGGDALVLWFYLVLIAICFCAGFAVAGKGQHTASIVHWFATTVMVGASLSVAVALLQAFDVWDGLPLINRTMSVRRPGGNLGQPNHLATLLLMGVASLAYLHETKKLGEVISTLLFLILIGGIALTESRTGLLSFMLMTLWWLARRRIVGFSASPLIVFCGCGILLLLVWAWPPFLAYIEAGGQADGLPKKSINLAVGTRFTVWPQLVEAAFQRPWFGWGLREVSTAHNAVLHAYSEGEPFSYAHNIILDLAVGMGLPLTIAMVIAFGFWLWHRIRAAKSLLPWYCIALAVPLGVHSLLEFPFAYAYLLAPVMLAIGLLEGTVATTGLFKVSWWVATVALTVVTATMAFSVLEYFAVEEDFRVARFEAMRIGQTPVEYVRPNIYLLTQLDALLEGARLSPTPGMTPEQIELARKVAVRYPWTATQNRYALTLALNGDQGEAIRQLKVIRAMHGEKSYERLKANWGELADTRYPQLKIMTIP